VTLTAAELEAEYTPAELAAWDAEYERNPLFRYANGDAGADGMSPGQESFHAELSRLRALIAGNQIGKTRAFAAECWWHALGEHPFRDVLPAPNVGWIIIPVLDSDWVKVCRKLREIEPPGALDPGCHYDSAKGYYYGGARRLKLACGSIMEPKSGTQHSEALEGDTIAWVGFDEPPRPSHWNGPLTRIAVNHGDAWLTFTPVGRPLEWLRTYFEGNAETETPGHPEWKITKIPLTPENCPHRTPEDIAEQIAAYDTWDYRQRVEAEWDGVTVGRALSSFTEGCIIDDEGLPETADEIRIGIDHGEGAGKQMAYVAAVVGRRYYLLAEYRGVKGSTPHEDAEGIVAMLTGLGLTVHHVTRAFGDVNSAGKLGGGGKLNAFLEAAIAKVCKLNQPPFTVEKPAKGAGSVKAGQRAINHACKEGRFFVHESCRSFIHAAKHYTGTEADLKDPIDAARYAIADHILVPHASPQPQLVI
jgi:hypothetical protein